MVERVLLDALWRWRWFPQGFDATFTPAEDAGAEGSMPRLRKRSSRSAASCLWSMPAFAGGLFLITALGFLVPGIVHSAERIAVQKVIII